VGNPARDGGAAGVVGTEDLSQEEPQRDQRREDAVQPAADGGQSLCDDFFAEDVREGQVTVLKKLMVPAYGEIGGAFRVFARKK
jgi:hypothetical protein